MRSRVDLDRQLELHVDALASIERNLVELEMDPIAELVRNTDFTGTTAARHADAVRRLAELWEQAALYRAGVRAAVAATEHEGWLRGDRSDELDHLLNDPVVVVDARTVPVLSRTLTGPDQVERRSTLSELLDVMEQTFDEARVAISDIDAAWRLLRDGTSASESALRELSALGADADPFLVERVRADLDDVAQLGTSDPIGAAERVQRATSMAEAAGAAGREAAARRVELRARCAALVGVVEDARAAVDAATRDAARCESRIAGGGALVVEPPAPATLDALAHRLERVRTTIDTGTPDALGAAAPAVAALEAEVAALAAAARAAAAANRAPLDERDELRGLLDAARAKAIARDVQERPHVAAVLREAHETLHAAPCDLARGRRLVTDLLAAVRDGGEAGARS